MGKSKGEKWVGAIALGMLVMAAPGAPQAADPLSASIREQESADKAAARSQKKIDRTADQSDKLFEDYKYTLRRTESLRVYNDHLQRMVDSQKAELASLDRQLAEIDTTNQGVIPLMARMVATLKQFIELDVPFLLDERRERVARLERLLDRADVTVSEKYRRVMEAYQIETEFGRTIEAYQASLALDGGERTVDFLRVGRVALIYQTLDGQQAGAWNAKEGRWEVLPDSYRSSITQGLRIARKQAAPDLLRLPVPAPERLQ